MQIILFEEERDDIQIAITAQVDADGNFALKGMDSGKLVKQMKGSYDYEYNISIKKHDKDLLIRKLALKNPSIKSDSEFMQWLKLNYNHNQAYSSFRQFLQEQEIAHDIFLWP